MNNKITSLKKARSLIDTMIKMVEDDKYCIDIMQQNLAVIGLLKNFHKSMLESHLHCCFKDAMQSNDVKLQEKMIQEILTATSYFNK